ELEDSIKVAEDESLSSYDNGNLSLSLMAVAGAFSKPENTFQEAIKKDIQDMLSEQKTGWQKLYDPNKGLLYGGYKCGKPVASLWIDRFYTEARTAAVAAILLADLPKQVWFNLLRSGNCPRSEYALSNGRSVSFLKPWQGAFQAWMPLLFIPECDLSPALKKAHNNYAAIQLDYAYNSNVRLLRSAAARPGCPEYVYEPCIGIFNASEDWVRSDIGSPHATALLYPVNPNAAVDLFKKALKDFPGLIGPLGFYDSVSESGSIAKVYLALDQLQMLLAFVSGANQQYLLDYLDSEDKLETLKSLYANIQF
ncbi:MAG: hypothetical protein PHQ54_03095, partial [Candidatus Omnitrophica bacterium]|nr:hypothetical protein [Candidatus Omnitrophota bacterium]